MIRPMQKKKFDDLLREQVLKYEQTHEPVFNQEKAWRKSVQNNTAYRVILAAASIILVAVLSLLLRPDIPQEIVVVRPTLTPEPKIESDIPEIVRKSRQQTIMVINSDLQAKTEILQPADSAQDMKRSRKNDTIFSIKAIPEAVVAVPDSNVDAGQQDIKVSFRRGSGVNSENPVRNKPEAKFSVRLFREHLRDTSAYVSNTEDHKEPKFRIKF